jgi:hypothetical protein
MNTTSGSFFPPALMEAILAAQEAERRAWLRLAPSNTRKS